MDNVKIDLFDLIRRLLHQWKFILIVTLICGLVFEGIGYARAYLDYRQELRGVKEEEEANLADEYLSDLEDMEEDLTEREIAEAQSAAAAYPSYISQYEKELLYCQNAVKMQLDSDNVSTYTLHYMITSSDTDTQIENLVTSVISDMIINDETSEEIRIALGWDDELSYIEELIEVETGGIVSENDTVLGMLTTMNQITIQIQAPQEEDCRTMADIIKTRITQGTAGLQETYGEFEILLLNESYAVKSDNDLRSYQDNRYSALNTLRGAVNSLTSGMTDDQKEYYYTLVSYGIVENGEEDEFALEEEEEESETAVSAPGIIRWRFIILGLFLGVVLACGYILLRYIFSKNLRVKDDLEDAFHIPTLGYIPLKGKRQRFTREERMEMICAGIRIAVQKADLKNIYFTGTAGDGESEKVMEQMQEALADCGAQVSSGRDVACDPASLEQMTASDGVVFVERVDRSPYADIQKEVELCQMYNVPVIGSVVIE